MLKGGGDGESSEVYLPASKQITSQPPHVPKRQLAYTASSCNERGNCLRDIPVRARDVLRRTRAEKNTNLIPFPFLLDH
jgi:hypothetical protein